MKTLNLFLAALCVTGGISNSLLDPFPLDARVLLPRGKGNDAYTPRKSSDRGGYNGDNAEPKGRPKHSAADVENAERVARERHKVKLPSADEYRRNSPPAYGETAITYSGPKDNIGALYAGKEMKQVSDHVRMRQKYDPSEKVYLHQPRPLSDEARKAGERQRTKLIRTLPTGPDLVRDHKPPSALYPKPGSIGTVGYDNSASQGLEGRTISAVRKPVIDNGYSDPKDASTWKGRGGVRIVPNTDPDPRYRPEIGPPGSNPRKYTVHMDDEDERRRRKRNTPPSRSSSGGSDYAITTKTRKGRHDPQRRGIAGVDDITNTEAASSSAASQPQNATSQAPDLQVYLDAWEIIYENATAILWPYIVDMLEGSNSSRVITAAWSVYAHMIPTPYVVTGPFHHGWTSLYSQEAQWATEANMTNATLTQLFALDDVLISLYTAAWDGGYNALNSSGVLDDLYWLTDVITLAYNASLPITMPDPANDPYADFFLSYDSIVPDSELDLNGTGIACPMATGTAALGAFGTGSPYSNGTLCTATAVPSGVIFPRRGLALRM